MKAIPSDQIPGLLIHLHAHVDLLVAIDMDYLLTHPNTTRCAMFVGRLRPFSDDGEDDWQDIGHCIRTGLASPVDICAWKVAELRLSGDLAAHVHFLERSGIIHVEVIDGSGKPIDPVRDIFGAPP